jgi:hypothetical protein
VMLSKNLMMSGSLVVGGMSCASKFLSVAMSPETVSLALDGVVNYVLKSAHYVRCNDCIAPALGGLKYMIYRPSPADKAVWDEVHWLVSERRRTHLWWLNGQVALFQHLVPCQQGLLGGRLLLGAGAGPSCWSAGGTLLAGADSRPAPGYSQLHDASAFLSGPEALGAP